MGETKLFGIITMRLSKMSLINISRRYSQTQTLNVQYQQNCKNLLESFASHNGVIHQMCERRSREEFFKFFVVLSLLILQSYSKMERDKTVKSQICSVERGLERTGKRGVLTNDQSNECECGGSFLFRTDCDCVVFYSTRFSSHSTGPIW